LPVAATLGFATGSAAVVLLALATCTEFANASVVAVPAATEPLCVATAAVAFPFSELPLNATLVCNPSDSVGWLDGVAFGVTTACPVTDCAAINCAEAIASAVTVAVTTGVGVVTSVLATAFVVVLLSFSRTAEAVSFFVPLNFVVGTLAAVKLCASVN
jgi:hypothetical protein